MTYNIHNKKENHAMELLHPVCDRILSFAFTCEFSSAHYPSLEG